MIGLWVSACAPGEFETHTALLLGLNNLIDLCPSLMLEVVEALIERMPLVSIVPSEQQRRQVLAMLCDWGLPAHLMQFVSMPVCGIWVRDYGPAFARRSDGRVAIIDAEYTLASRKNDDMVPRALASLLGCALARAPIIGDGGFMLGNGQGLCITTTRFLSHNMARGYTQPQIHRVLTDYYGFSTGAVLCPLENEKTGHVDMFATFTAANVIVLGSYNPANDPVNADILDKNADILRRTESRLGPLKIVRIPMPNNKDGVFRTYTNVIYANGALLVPSYPDQDQTLEQDAFDIYAGLLPGWRIVPIDCSEVIRFYGALHCMCVQIPWLADRFPPPTPRPRDRRAMDAAMLAAASR